MLDCVLISQTCLPVLTFQTNSLRPEPPTIRCKLPRASCCIESWYLISGNLDFKSGSSLTTMLLLRRHAMSLADTVYLSPTEGPGLAVAIDVLPFTSRIVT